MSRTVDPITLEVVCEGLISIVREMRASIIRASYSPAIYELDDFSCAMFNAGAEMVAQGQDHPGHVCPCPGPCAAPWTTSPGTSSRATSSFSTIPTGAARI